MASTIPAQESISNAHSCESELWNRVIARLKFIHGEATYNSWFKHMSLDNIEGCEATICAPTRFVREWILSHYSEDILKALKAENNEISFLDIKLASSVAKSNFSKSLNDVHSDAVVKKPAAIKNITYNSGNNYSKAPAQAGMSSVSLDDLSAKLDARLTFDNFVVGSTNELAHAAAKSIAESETVIAGSNPLFLHGGVGLGKTHLMQAIAHDVKKNNPSRKVLYLSAEKFAYQFIKALRNKDIVSFKEYFRSVDILMIDDIQFICGKNSTQEEFFHTFNALIDNNKQLILSGDRSPSDLDGLEDRVKSRLGWGLVADINSTTYELRLGILQSRIEAMKKDVPMDVLEFLARKISSNVRELEGALNKVIAYSRLTKRDITIDTAQIILKDLLRSTEKNITIEDIKKMVADHCNIKISDMHSARRAREVARPRQIAMYLAKKLTPCSLPEIGRKFGGKDHTTVMHAVKRIEKLCIDDPELGDDVNILLRKMQG